MGVEKDPGHAGMIVKGPPKPGISLREPFRREIMANNDIGIKQLR